MAEVRWTSQAADDLDAIAEFIASDSPHYASLFVLNVMQSVGRLEQFSKLGRIVPETSDPNIRELISGNYRIVYRLTFETPEIVTIYHGARILDPDNLK